MNKSPFSIDIYVLRTN